MENYAASETCLLLAEADRVLCLLLCFNCLFALDLQNEIQLLSYQVRGQTGSRPRGEMWGGIYIMLIYSSS